MDRVTIIRADGFVSVDGLGFSDLDLSFIDPDIHAVQWYGTEGEIEWRVDGRKYFNTDIAGLEEFQPALDAWSAAKQAAESV